MGYADGPGGRHPSAGGGDGGWLCSNRPLLRCRSRRYLEDLSQHAQGRKRLAFWGGGRIYALDTTTFVSLSSKLQGTLRFLQPSQGCSPEHLIFCLRQREHLYHMAIVLDERPALSGKERVENEGLARWMIFLPFFWRLMSP